MRPFTKMISIISGIAGRRAWIKRGSPTAPAAAGMLGVAYYHPELEEIGNGVNVWRLRGERDRDFAHRIATELAAKLNALEADLDRVITISKPQPPGSMQRNPNAR
jgi:hypothetical protein